MLSIRSAVCTCINIYNCGYGLKTTIDRIEVCVVIVRRHCCALRFECCERGYFDKSMLCIPLPRTLTHQHNNPTTVRRPYLFIIFCIRGKIDFGLCTSTMCDGCSLMHPLPSCHLLLGAGVRSTS